MRSLLPVFALILLALSLSLWDASDASEIDSDDTVYGYETHGSGHPYYYGTLSSRVDDSD